MLSTVTNCATNVQNRCLDKNLERGVDRGQTGWALNYQKQGDADTDRYKDQDCTQGFT